MAQGGEFAFVLYASATQFGILSPEWNANLTAIIIISMVLTPLTIMVHQRLATETGPSVEGLEEAHDLRGSVLLIGFGRVGQIVSQPLLAAGYSVSIIDKDPEPISDAKEHGFRVWYGDGSRLDILHAAGAQNARLVNKLTEVVARWGCSIADFVERTFAGHLEILVAIPPIRFGGG